MFRYPISTSKTITGNIADALPDVEFLHADKPAKFDDSPVRRENDIEKLNALIHTYVVLLQNQLPDIKTIAMTSKPANSSTPPATPLPLVTEFTATANGKGRLFKMEPGKWIELDSTEDQWEPNKEESIDLQASRILHGPRLRAHEELVRRVCVAEYSSNPLWQKRAERDPEYWSKFYVGRINLSAAEISRLPSDETPSA